MINSANLRILNFSTKAGKQKNWYTTILSLSLLTAVLVISLVSCQSPKEPLPTDIPLIKNATLSSSTSCNNTYYAWYYQLDNKATSVEEVKTFYQQQLPQNKWQVASANTKEKTDATYGEIQANKAKQVLDIFVAKHETKGFVLSIFLQKGDTKCELD